MSEEKVLGEYELKKFEISNGGQQKLDVRNIITEWNIVESMNNGFLSGTATIVDTKNQVQKFPFQGEEKIVVEYTDYYDTTLKETYFLYAVEHMQMRFLQSDEVQEYKLHFCSFAKTSSKTQIVRKANQGPVSQFAQDIFSSYLQPPMQTMQSDTGVQVKSLDAETSSDNPRLVIPSYETIDALHFLSRNAYTSGQSSGFKFFETREKFWFASPEYVSKKSLQKQQSGLAGFGGTQGPGGMQADRNADKQVFNFYVHSPGDFDPENVIEKRMHAVLGVKYLTRVNTIDDYNKGAYHRRIIHLDVLHREIYAEVHKFPEKMAQYFQGSQMHARHGQGFVDSMMPEPYDVWVIKDWTSTNSAQRPDPNHATLYGSKAMQMVHDDQNTIQIVIYGRNNIFAGDVVELSLPEFAEREDYTVDKERSGKYLIMSCNNEFIGDGYKQTLTLTRTGQAEDLSKSKWQKVQRLTPDEKIPGAPEYGPGSEQAPGGAAADQNQDQQTPADEQGKVPPGGNDATGEDLLSTAQTYEGMNEVTDQQTLTNFMNGNSGTAPLDINGPQGPWCAKYANSVLGANGIQGTGSNYAASFNSYGTSVGSLANARPGDIAVLNGGSHVGFIQSVNPNGTVSIISGNLNNSVVSADFSAGQVTNIRRATVN